MFPVLGFLFMFVTTQNCTASPSKRMYKPTSAKANWLDVNLKLRCITLNLLIFILFSVIHIVFNCCHFLIADLLLFLFVIE